MDDEDRKDIIKKVNTSGNDSESSDMDVSNDDDNNSNDNNDEFGGSDSNNDEFGGEEVEEPLDELQIFENEDIFLANPKKNNMFQEGSNDILDEAKPCWAGYKQVGMKEKNGKEVPNCVPINENEDYDFTKSSIESASGDRVVKREEDEYGRPLYWSLSNDNVNYFIGSSGEIVKYDAISGKNIVIGNMREYSGQNKRKDDPNNLYYENNKNVKNLINKEKNSTFDRNYLLSKIHETFNQDEMNTVEPKTAPTTKPAETKPFAPSRRNKPFLPMPEVEPDPKALKEGVNDYQVYHNSFSSAVQTAKEYAELKGYQISDDDWFTSVSTGPKRPKEGQTNRYSISLYRDGKEQRKTLNFQVYGMVNKYELNAYIS